jgi:phosphinothricin acetyltransferase
MIVCNAERADVARIVEIYNQAVLRSTATADYEPHTLEQRLAWYDQRVARGHPILVARTEDGGPIVGWGSLGPYHSRAAYARTVENSVYVDESSRGIGVGTAILSELVERARAMGCHAIVAVIAGGNEYSERLHARFGFKEYGRLPELMRKFDEWIDAVYMVKLLD